MDDKNFAHTLVLTNEELTVIFNALAEQPYKDAAPIIGTMQQQLQAEMEEKKKQFSDAEVKEHLKEEKK
jgi:hypothetical protein